MEIGQKKGDTKRRKEKRNRQKRQRDVNKEVNDKKN